MDWFWQFEKNLLEYTTKRPTITNVKTKVIIILMYVLAYDVIILLNKKCEQNAKSTFLHDIC